MPNQAVTLHLPEPIYRQLSQRAAQTHRTIEAETLALLATALPEPDELPAGLTETLDAMAVLDESALWTAARSRMDPAAADTLQKLNLKRQREGLTDGESQEAASLLREYERVMLIRAQAAALLKQRGHDVSSLLAAL